MEYDLARELEYEAQREKCGMCFDKNTATATAICKVSVGNINNEFQMKHKIGPDFLVRTVIEADVDDEGGVDVSTARPVEPFEFDYVNLFKGFEENDNSDNEILKIKEIVDCSCWWN